MCGIAGIYQLNSAPVSIEELKKMTNSIIHRGPDGEGFWIRSEGSIGFGHRRLSIIDLSANGSQPMHYLNRYTITYNGEIYNYIEMKEQLVKKGYLFKSNSDTEVLLALYDLKKEKCLEDLDGMFSFAIWDEHEKTLFCARDRFGEKPFNYYLDHTRFVFASEIKQFWTLGIAKKIEEIRLMQYVQTGMIDDANDISSTFYKNIKRLDAAHYLLIDSNKKIRIEKYWDIDLNAKPYTGTIELAAEKFLELFTSSVRVRLRSDVPVGSSLSGGLDSSSIVMIIDALKGNELKQNTFSARFKDYYKDEGKYMDEVVKACKNMQVHNTWLTKEYFEKVFDKVTFHQDEPYSSASVVAQYAVMELAKENKVTVLLDGQGADEQLAGYIHYYHTWLHQLFYAKSSSYKTEYAAYVRFHETTKPHHYRPVNESETIAMKLGRYKRIALNQDMPYKNQLAINLKNSTTKIGLKELLRYADRNSMAHSREVRLPFLNHKLVEFVFSLPDNYKLNGGWTKFILRKAMTSILPESICWRIDKVAYEPPQKDWITSDWCRNNIEKASNVLNIKKGNEDSSPLDWRLLMASKFI